MKEKVPYARDPITNYANAFSVSFVVPSYRRTDALRRNLERLLALTPAPTEIIVLYHDDDQETGDVARSYRVRTIEVPEPGQVPSLLAGYSHAVGDVVAVLDDDAVPDFDWLDRCLRHFADPDVGMVGGRDRVYTDETGLPLPGPGGPVGLLRNWGDLIGNHHSGIGRSRRVDHLKGCNYVVRAECVRRSFVALTVLKGEGAQMASDTATSLSVRGAGWSLIYDPQAQVAHFPGIRPSGDDRNSVDPRNVFFSSYNETLMRLSFVPLPWVPVAFLFAVLAGTGHSPGLLRSLVARFKNRPTAAVSSLSGVLAAAAAMPSLRLKLRRERRALRHD